MKFHPDPSLFQALAHTIALAHAIDLAKSLNNNAGSPEVIGTSFNTAHAEETTVPITSVLGITGAICVPGDGSPIDVAFYNVTFGAYRGILKLVEDEKQERWAGGRGSVKVPFNLAVRWSGTLIVQEDGGMRMDCLKTEAHPAIVTAPPGVSFPPTSQSAHYTIILDTHLEDFSLSHRRGRDLLGIPVAIESNVQGEGGSLKFLINFDTSSLDLGVFRRRGGGHQDGLVDTVEGDLILFESDFLNIVNHELGNL
jgi:hypothetical protein